MAVYPHADLVDGLTPLIDVVLAKPRIVLEFYEFGIVLRKPREDGETAYTVAPDSIAAALSASMEMETGLLSEGTLYIMRDGLRSVIAEFRPPQMTGLWIEGSEQPYRIPMPGLLLVRDLKDKRPDYILYAVNRRPEDMKDKLFRAPLPHVGLNNGHICWGTVPTPDVKKMRKTTSLAEDWALLMGSRFGSHTVEKVSKKYPKDIRKMYAELETRKTKRYPAADLVEAGLTLGGMLERFRSKK